MVSTKVTFPAISLLALLPWPDPVRMVVLDREFGPLAPLKAQGGNRGSSYKSRCRQLQGLPLGQSSSLPTSLLGVQMDGPAQSGIALCLPWLVGKRLLLTFCFDS